MPLPATAVRATLAAAWPLHLAPTGAPELLDAVLRLPLFDAGRTREELGWAPTLMASEAIADFLEGLREGAGPDTAPLVGAPGGGAR
ncbi:hypothetical protein ACFTUC_29195 [Streptomyces sp. NPDC056944]|uniref:hypothetical protein n=1 Tax=unclassified Streptomyces TaxID=2593676 RepID=UPI0036432D63